MSRLGKIVFTILCVGAVSFVGWRATAALTKTNPTVDASVALKMQRNLARVQRNGLAITNLQLQISMLSNEVSPEIEELKVFCKEKVINYDELIKGNVVIADNGSVTKTASAQTSAPSIPAAPPVLTKPNPQHPQE